MAKHDRFPQRNGDLKNFFKLEFQLVNLIFSMGYLVFTLCYFVSPNDCNSCAC